jgi:hypothetical protein
LALLVVPVVLVAVGAVLIFVLGGGEVASIIGQDDDADVVPEFEFKLSKIDVEPTAGEADSAALEEAAEGVAIEIVPILDELYTNGYLDPANWREGDYEEIFGLFSDAAAGPAREGIETLTLGAGAGDVYDRVTPRKGGLQFKVLFDPEEAPDTVAVRIRFFALGERKDGEFISIFSGGQMTLRDLEGWKIVAFDMRRNDKVTVPPAPAPSGSPSGSPGGSTTGATGATAATGTS